MLGVIMLIVLIFFYSYSIGFFYVWENDICGKSGVVFNLLECVCFLVENM